MQNTNEIRAHIAAVKQTRKITNAMHLVASSRLKKVMSHIEYNNAYFSRVQATMKDILQSSESVTHQYLTGRGAHISSWRGIRGWLGRITPACSIWPMRPSASARRRRRRIC